MSDNIPCKINIDGEWRNGNITNINGTECTVYGCGAYSFYKEIVDRKDVIRHEKMSEEKQKEIIEKEFPIILNLIKKLASNHLKFGTDIVITAQHNMIYCAKWGVSISPKIYEIRSIGKFIDFLGWEVMVYSYQYASYWEEESHKEEPVAQPLPLNEAALLFIKTVFGRILDSFLDRDFISTQDIF